MEQPGYVHAHRFNRILHQLYSDVASYDDISRYISMEQLQSLSCVVDVWAAVRVGPGFSKGAMCVDMVGQNSL